VPKHTSFLVLLFSIALSARLTFFFLVTPYEPSVQSNLILQSDALGYHLLAQTLVKSHEFSYQEGGAPDCLRTPGYPLFIGFFYLLFGAKPWIPIFFQLFIDSASCVLLYEILLKFSAHRIALFSSLFYSFDPFLIFFSVTLLSEILFIFLLLVATFYFTKAIELNFNPPSKRAICIAGLFFGLATLVRPISLYLIIIIPIFLCFFLRHNLRLFLTATFLFATVFSFTISPWILRNFLSYDAGFLSTSGAYNLLMLYVSPMEAEKRGLSSRDAMEQLSHEVDSVIVRSGSHPSNLNAFQKSKHHTDLAIHYILNNPTLFLKHYFLGIVHSFASLGTKGFAEALNLPTEEGYFDIKGHKSLWVTVTQFLNHKTFSEKVIGATIFLYLLIEYFCLTIGIIVSWKLLNKRFLLFCLMLAAYFILLAGPFGNARFRLPALPFYLVFIAVGLDILYSKMQGRHLRNQQSRQTTTISL